MTEQTKNLILEHLHAIRTKQDQHGEEFHSLKLRMSFMETQMANVHFDLANVHPDPAILHSRFDGVDLRLDRIEKRLELTNA